MCGSCKFFPTVSFLQIFVTRSHDSARPLWPDASVFYSSSSSIYSIIYYLFRVPIQHRSTSSEASRQLMTELFNGWFGPSSLEVTCDRDLSFSHIAINCASIRLFQTNFALTVMQFIDYLWSRLSCNVTCFHVRSSRKNPSLQKECCMSGFFTATEKLIYFLVAVACDLTGSLINAR